MITGTYVLGLVGAALAVGLVVELLRRRHLRGKYALVYLCLCAAAALFAVFPSSLDVLSQLVGVQLPVNLLFFASTVVLLLVTMHLAYESGRLEEETRTLAEEVGLLRLELEQVRDHCRHHP